MRHRANKRFWHEYWAFSEDIRNRADKQFELLKANPRHPSLQFKKVGERPAIGELWSARVTLDYRALALKRADGYVWFWIGEHSVYDSLIT